MQFEFPPYALRWEPSWDDDLAKIHPGEGARDAVLDRLAQALEWNPFAYARLLGELEGMRIYLVSTRHFKADEDFPNMYVTFSVVRDPPDGLLSLRRVLSEADVRAGLHGDFLA
jgi:hypothetical protein